jgi:hypothetical protein
MTRIPCQCNFATIFPIVADRPTACNHFWFAADSCPSLVRLRSNNEQSRVRERCVALLPKFLKSLPQASLSDLRAGRAQGIGTALAPTSFRKRDGASPDRWSSDFRRRAVRSPVEAGAQAAGSPLALCLGDDEVRSMFI